jgi:ParB-like chromosome segregation protein Spo0J
VYRIHHEPLSDLEKAESIKRLMEIKGWNVPEAASEIGLAERYLRTVLSLVDALKEVKKLVEDKKIEPSTAGE